MAATIITTTVSNLQEAKKIAHLLVEKKLAACINIIGPVLSIYKWENKIQQDQEYKLFIKTNKSHWNLVERLIIENHSYSVPEITQMNIKNIHLPYKKWIDKIVS